MGTGKLWEKPGKKFGSWKRQVDKSLAGEFLSTASVNNNKKWCIFICHWTWNCLGWVKIYDSCVPTFSSCKLKPAKKTVWTGCLIILSCNTHSYWVQIRYGNNYLPADKAKIEQLGSGEVTSCGKTHLMRVGHFLVFTQWKTGLKIKMEWTSRLEQYLHVL